MAATFELFGTESVSLDSFQQTLLQMTNNASATSLSKFFSKNYRPLYQFILRLYLTSLTSHHPDRGHTSKHNNDDGYTVKEHKILAEWANLLTDDEPLNKDAQQIMDIHQKSKPTATIDVDAVITSSNDNNASSSPNISSSNTSKAITTYAKVDDKRRNYKRKNKTNTKHQHSQSSQSFSGIAQYAQYPTAIAMRGTKTNNNREAYMAYTDSNKKSSSHKRKKGGVTFNCDPKSDNNDNNMMELELSSCDDIKQQYHEIRNDPQRRGSIWDGVLDINNIIMIPETPKWRPRFSFQQNQLLQEGLLDSILYTISPKIYQRGANQMGLMDEVQVTSVDAMCLFLPFLCVISNNNKENNELQMAILQRVRKEVDVKQHFEFFLNAYKDASDLKKSFSKTNNMLMMKQRINTSNTNTARINNEDSISISPYFGSESNNNIDDISLSSKESIITISNQSQCEENIIQQTPESAISLFQSIFRKNLGAGSEIKLSLKSLVRDPINCHAPPLSRIEIRKIIGTNSKPYLIDLYVANRSDNFEYLSSTVILKKGDDLRRDAAVLHVFRLMNKIWREKGLEFTQVPVNALTYKCVAMSPLFGIIELIEGCKPLRLVSALEDTITIAQQFNLVASAAGSYMASYVMGVRDRHFDNVLIRDTDCTLFHIDFGFVLGDTASVDTSKFAITSDLKKLMGVFWDKFIELGVQAFLSLRQKHKYLIKYARVAFQYLNNPQIVEEFLKSQLLIDIMTDDKAAKYIARKLKESPDSVKTKFKNVVHQIATYKK